MKKFLKLSLLLAAAFAMVVLAGCGGGEKKAAKNDAPLKVGVTPGPHAEVMDEVKKIAETGHRIQRLCYPQLCFG